METKLNDIVSTLQVFVEEASKAIDDETFKENIEYRKGFLAGAECALFIFNEIMKGDIEI